MKMLHEPLLNVNNWNMVTVLNFKTYDDFTWVGICSNMDN
jgi:hypothetical protein